MYCAFPTSSRVLTFLWSVASGISCPDVCPTGWPNFLSHAHLAANKPWSTYFQVVYGQVPSSADDYPLCIGCLWMLYDDIIESALIRDLPPVTGKCPNNTGADGSRYLLNNMYQPSAVSWSWHPYPYRGFASNSRVEVIHTEDPFGDETVGAWMLYAKGSGIWFDVGRTAVFSDHADAYDFFNVNIFELKEGVPKDRLNELMSKAAAEQGYDSVQFVAHNGPLSYAKCDSAHTGVAGLDFMNIEIVAVKLVGTYSCMASHGAPASVTAGWRGSQPCKCDVRRKFLNCQLFDPSPPALAAVPSLLLM
mmetsp:Transcript_35752/g.63713  ORF Transcript_35752/g.63713 Transcript_35752/m.63713 type:complete len:306 (-) Transcript_35752:154-1071(-)